MIKPEPQEADDTDAYKEYVVNPSVGNGIRPATSKAIHVRRHPAVTPNKSRRHHRREMFGKKLSYNNYTPVPGQMTPSGSYTNILGKQRRSVSMIGRRNSAGVTPKIN
jgi:hypothetical protein